MTNSKTMKTNKAKIEQILKEHSLWIASGEADGKRADLKGAYLRGANLRGANLQGVDLRGVNLKGANLRGANLQDANLRGVNLLGANLREAYLYGANLQDANLRGVDLPHFQIVPEKGSFTAFKKITTGVIEVLIPDGAKRTSTLVGRKCRAEYVKVIGGDCGGKSPTKGNLVYEEGAIVHADKFDDDIRVECTNGIHFFMTREEAEDWR